MTWSRSRQAFEVFKGWQAAAFLLLTAVAWAVFAQLFIEYREPKIFGAIYGVGVLAAIVVGKLG